MAALPDRVKEFPCLGRGGSSKPVNSYLMGQGYKLLSRGKVRDTYEVPGHPDQLLVVASDRLSIFDFVLPTLVPGKGEILTAWTHFMLTNLLKAWPHHLLPSDFRQDPHFPAERSLLVKRVQIQPFELIFRAHLGGSVWKEYQEKQTAGGHNMPPALTRWQQLRDPIFTPSTKAESGHDVNITYQQYYEAMGDEGRVAVEQLRQVYRFAYGWARQRGILFLDTKFEAGVPFIIADEVLTPDSSRITTLADHQQAIAESRDPIFYDKEPVRQYGRTVPTPFGVTGIHKLDPENPEHLAFVHNELVVPSDIVAEMAQRYHWIFEQFVGQTLRQYQQNVIGLAV